MQQENKLQRERRRANFRLIERELYCYELTKRRLAEMRSDIIDSTPVSDVPTRAGHGDPTANTVLRLNSAALVEAAKRLAAIESVCRELRERRPEQYRLLRLRYFEQRLTDVGIQMELHISPRTFRRWRREIVQMVADRLGWEI